MDARLFLKETDICFYQLVYRYIHICSPSKAIFTLLPYKAIVNMTAVVVVCLPGTTALKCISGVESFSDGTRTPTVP